MRKRQCNDHPVAIVDEALVVPDSRLQRRLLIIGSISAGNHSSRPTRSYLANSSWTGGRPPPPRALAAPPPPCRVPGAPPAPPKRPPPAGSPPRPRPSRAPP